MKFGHILFLLLLVAVGYFVGARKPDFPIIGVRMQ